MANNWAFEGRLSRIASDGYIDRASSDLESYYVSGGYFGKKTSLQLIHIQNDLREEGSVKELEDLHKTLSRITSSMPNNDADEVLVIAKKLNNFVSNG